jgi:hypothetical protein
MLKGLECCGA